MNPMNPTGQPQYAAGPPDPLVNSGSSKNWMGITGLITSFLCCLAFVGVIFGVLGLRAAKRGQATNRGVSLAAIVIGSIVSLASVAGVAYLVSNGAEVIENALEQTAPGRDVVSVKTVLDENIEAGTPAAAIGVEDGYYYVNGEAIKAELDSPQVAYYPDGDRYCLEISSGGSRAQWSNGGSCEGTPAPNIGAP